MTDLENMDASELRCELDAARETVLALTQELCDAVDSGDFAWTAGLVCALKPALVRVRRLRRALQLGVAH